MAKETKELLIDLKSKLSEETKKPSARSERRCLPFEGCMTLSTSMASESMLRIKLTEIANSSNVDETAYLDANPDIVAAVSN